ncbi:hypothetical protein NPIL_340691 [Nephila pilipes]|uniref:Uncharacterized protein n=1 Tax=Nephila pilipes TaxID=299642 RepID=A0A8X6MT77_NEPPI|nr:hypothetical protein NPIL_340691 [Nephila pilipes]
MWAETLFNPIKNQSFTLLSKAASYITFSTPLIHPHAEIQSPSNHRNLFAFTKYQNPFHQKISWQVFIGKFRYPPLGVVRVVFGVRKHSFPHQGDFIREESR